MSSSSTSNKDESRPMNDTTMPPPKKGTQVPRRRLKQGVRNGCGLHDWHRLVKSSKNLSLAGSAGIRKIRPSEIRQHNSVHDGWISLHGKVYNLSPYMAYHPGGLDILKSVLGRDTSALYDKYHRWVNADGLIGALLIGYLEKDDGSEDEDTPSYLPPQHHTARSDSDGFAIPAPRRAKAGVTSLLTPKGGDSEEEEEDGKESFGE